VIHYGVVTGLHSQGLYVRINELQTEYGPLTHLGLPADYVVGSTVLVGHVGLTGDEYVVLGVVRP
jgi:hypothetical protein